jgi:hypothetical protein
MHKADCHRRTVRNLDFDGSKQYGILKAVACDERIRLLLECSQAARDYADAVSIMGAVARSSDHEEYDKARKTAESFRSVLTQARLALNQHTAQHSCQTETPGAQI